MRGRSSLAGSAAATGYRLLKVASCLERTQRQELAVQGNHGAGAAFRVFDLFQVQLEVDRADDAVAELLVNQGFERGAVDLDHFVETVDGRVGRNTRQAAAQRDD